MAGLPSLVEVMALVSVQVRGADSSAATELTGTSDPLRVTASHVLSLRQRQLTVTVEIYNRLLVDVKGASIRRVLRPGCHPGAYTVIYQGLQYSESYCHWRRSLQSTFSKIWYSL